jgi:transposase
MKSAYYIGCDLAAEVSVACVVNKEGAMFSSTRFLTTEQAIRNFLNSVPRPRYFAVEETSQADWVLRIAREECDNAISCRTFKKGELSGENKNDDADAYNLAQKLRLNDLVEVWHDSGLRRRDIMQYALTYMAMVKETTREKNRIRAVFRAVGIRDAKAAYEPSSREEMLKKLKLEGERHRVRLYGEALDKVTTLRRIAWRELYREIIKYSLFKRLSNVPAFGRVSAALATAIIWDPVRFKNKRHFWSYCGFSLRTKDSGEYYQDKKTGKILRKKKSFVLGLTREYNREMKVIFKRAATTLRRKQWKEEFQRLRGSGISLDNATLTLARKVSAIALHMAKYGGKYEEDKVFMTR